MKKLARLSDLADDELLARCHALPLDSGEHAVGRYRHTPDGWKSSERV